MTYKSLKEVYEEVREYMLLSMIPSKEYRDSQGRFHGIGCLIKVGYTPEIEGTAVCEINDSRLPLPGILALKKCLLENGVNANQTDTIELLYELQRVHDDKSPEEWDKELQAVRRKWGF